MEAVENPGRERILSRIVSSVKAAAPRKGGGPESAGIFTPVGDPLKSFQEQCVASTTECIVVADGAAAKKALSNVLASVPSGEIYVQDAPVLHRTVEGWSGHAVRWSGLGPPNESVQATVTLAEYAVASHGSLLVSSSCGGRGSSVVAPVHIVVASESQLVPDLSTALASVKKRGLAERNSCLFLITGSSRTADIEKILVLGAHGPRRLVVILARELD
jgi:L-lactate utilization protein LutC